MSDEPFDAKRIAAECKAKVGRPRKKGEAPAIPVVEAEAPAEKAIHHRSKFRPEMIEQARKLCQYGATIPEVADFFDVKKTTFEGWMQRHPELEEAVRLGSDPANQRAKMSLYAQAIGYDYVEEQAVRIRIGAGKESREVVEVVEVRKHMPANYSATALFLTNKLPDEFRHRKSSEVGGHVTLGFDRKEAEKELLDFLKGEVAPTRAEAAPKPH